MRRFFCGNCLEWHHEYVITEHSHLTWEAFPDSQNVSTADLIALARQVLRERGRDDDNIDLLLRGGLESDIKKQRILWP